MSERRESEVASRFSPSKEHSAILDRLTEQERVLILCNDQLYDGRWDLLLHDLVERLEGRSYVFKLGDRIHEDIERVKRLMQIEIDNDIKLSDYVKL